MIQLPSLDLAPSSLTELVRLQTLIDSCVGYANQVKEAQLRWERKSETTFRPVRQTLRRMVGKSHRCAYCEDSEANQIEHIHPKTLYPERTFDWSNYLFACGLCNPEKRDQFAVFPGVDAHWVDVQRPRNALVIPPIAGEPLLINPRLEDPMQFLFLEMRGGTFLFYADITRTVREQERANYTIKILGLNMRPGLVRFRRSEFGMYRAGLKEYIQERDRGESPRQLRRLIGALKRRPHRTIWKEMQRQADRIPEIQPLFAAAPEALLW